MKLPVLSYFLIEVRGKKNAGQIQNYLTCPALWSRRVPNYVLKTRGNTVFPISKIKSATIVPQLVLKVKKPPEPGSFFTFGDNFVSQWSRRDSNPRPNMV